ncbi:MAG: SMC-Scp complex subunit ScpB [Patescibacteria group bacterium]|nr:SMC-Scp complex subunit ScpB [Patescibacteria group bacterium]
MSKLKSKIESLLFITNQPFSFKKLADITKSEKADVGKAVEELMTEYNNDDKGIQIQKIDDKVQMVTSGENSKLVKDFIKEETTGELTRASLETLTIIAYRGPINRAELEQIRGVNCAVILRNLLMRGLVEAAEDKKKMQMSYSITLDFLKFLGINQQSELPDYAKLNSSESLSKILSSQALPTAE